jgi:bacterioferritin-associated ferredoxin
VELDDELCLCFHVTKRKVLNFIRREQPRRAGQLSECFGAGTGCGWCRAYLTKLFQQEREQMSSALPDAEQYAQMRARYVRQGRGTPPPGATPLPDD